MTRTHALVPYLITDGGIAAIDFYVRALGAIETYRLLEGDRIAHAELTIEGARFMLADEYPNIDCIGPIRRGGTSVSLTVYVSDVDASVARAIAAGARLERPVEDQFYGERVGWIVDPFGHRWSLNSVIEQLSPATIRERYAALR
ncbi:MAG TPA: VOC family protein [Polyangiales bacterium]|nr:VOC family protein [Polyangiales bacterium]